MANWAGTKVDELRLIATETYGVEVPEGATKAEIDTLLLEQGVSEATHKQYLKNIGAEVPEDEEEIVVTTPTVEVVTVPVVPVVAEEKLLIKMTRPNRSYETHGIRFTWDNPFALVPESTADEIFRTEQGFEMAKPAEVREYYS